MQEKKPDDRMRELVKLFEKKDEIFVNEEKEPVNEDVINNEYDRLSKLANKDTNHLFREDYFTSNNYGMGAGQTKTNGRSVNSIIDQMYSNPSVAYHPIRQPLTAEEALELAINRALKSGAPVNGMGWYDEVNWNLNNLGFPAKSPIDIKGCMTKMMENER